MNEQTKHYGSLALALAAALGVVSGLALAGFAPKSPKTAQGG
jgi:hypothetical protein